MVNPVESDVARFLSSLAEIIYIIPDYEETFIVWVKNHLESFLEGNEATQDELDNLGLELKTNSCFWNSQKITIRNPEYLYYEGVAMNDNITESMHHGFNFKEKKTKDFTALEHFSDRYYRYHGIYIPSEFITSIHSLNTYEEAIAENPQYVPFCPIIHKYFYFDQGMTLEDANQYGTHDKTVFF